jgi:hypothetical protein
VYECMCECERLSALTADGLRVWKGGGHHRAYLANAVNDQVERCP